MEDMMKEVKIMRRKTKKFIKVLRVTQLDGEQIDAQLFNVIKSEIKSALLTKPFTLLLHFEPEINVIIRYILWKISLGRDNMCSTLGQAMLNTERLFQKNNLNSTKKNWYMCLVILIYWVKERESTLTRLLELTLRFCKKDFYVDTIKNYLSRLETFVYLLSLLNFLIFIKNGVYSTLLDRIFQWQYFFKSDPSPRYIDFDYMKQEMRRQIITETAIAILPFINFAKLFDVIHTQLCKIFGRTYQSEVNLHESFICNICREKAINPYTSHCKHIFCYYCLKGNMDNITDFSCPVCNEVILSTEPLDVAMFQ